MSAFPSSSDPPDVPERGNGRLVGNEGALLVTNAVVRLLRAHSGRGPTTARTMIASDLVVVHLRDCLTIAEKTVRDSGHPELVARGREVLHAAIRDEATAVVEEVSGRHVVAYLSTLATNPEHALIAFVLEGRPAA